MVSNAVGRMPNLAATDVWRGDICELIKSTASSLVILAAPAGYGKSVTAAQLAQGFDRVFWYSLNGQDLSPAVTERILHEVHGSNERLATDQASDAGMVGRNLSSRAAEPSWVSCSPASVAVVLDSVGSDTDTQHLSHLLDALGRETDEFRVIVTARDVREWDSIVGIRDLVIIEKDVLSFSWDEACEFASKVSLSAITGEFVRECYEQSGGQPALFTLLVRHPWGRRQSGSIRSGEEASVALAQCVRTYIETALSPHQFELLACAALLSPGSIRDLESCMSGTDIASSIRRLSECFPLVRVTEGPPQGFYVHDLVLDALVSRSRDKQRIASLAVVQRAMRLLELQGRFGHLFQVTYELMGEEQLARALSAHGQSYLRTGAVREVQAFLGSISASCRINHPRVLLLEAEVSEHLGHYDEALETMNLVERIADSSAQDDLRAESIIRQVRTLLAMGRVDAARDVLLRARGLGFSDLHRRLQDYLACWSLVVESAYLNSFTLRLKCGDILGRLRAETNRDDLHYRLLNALGFLYAAVLGDMSLSTQLFRAMSQADLMMQAGSAMGLGNLSVALLHMGRTRSASQAAEAALQRSVQSGSSNYITTWQHNRALIASSVGDYETYVRERDYCCGRLSQAATPSDMTQFWSLDSLIMRSTGRNEEALESAEQACVHAEHLGWWHFRFEAHTERLASRLALGDEELVYNEGVELRKELEGTGYSFYLLRLDMVLAEIERRRGEIDRAASRIAEHADHIRGEGSNWHMAMYTRAFPGLLGVFARALGPDGIPIHMLRMLLEPCATRSLELARSLLDDADWRRLVLRTLGKAKGAAFLQAHEGPPVLRVRLFGGLQVEGPNGAVPDKAWGKRKARLLFAMLAMNRGRDVPRDVLFERLWPDMTADKAQSNFYVTWSYMKKALAPDGGPCPYLEHRGGVCRIVPEAVHTDLAEFLEAAGALRKAKARGDADAVISAAERMAELHSGELLAGDLYEDWCEDTRVHARHELSDAMLAGAEALAERGAPERAVRLVRHALAFDPWREDLYQAALRYQIMAGQRSGAIETYMTCRTKLAEDLGLDPSQETQRLYEQVLAMEDVGESAVPA